MKRVRVYDNGGETIDRYTVLFLKAARFYNKYWIYLAMDGNPTHPQGFCQHGEVNNISDLAHWGKVIPFKKLPAKCQALVLSEARP